MTVNSEGENDRNWLERGFSYDVITSQFCKSSYLRPSCWFHFARPSIGKHNIMSPYSLFSSYYNTKVQLSDKNIHTYTRLNGFFSQNFWWGGGTCFRGQFLVPVGTESDGGGNLHQGRSQIWGDLEKLSTEAKNGPQQQN